MSVLTESQKEILVLIDRAEKIFESSATWELKYDLIFGMGIHNKIDAAELSFTWYDPDTSYQEDVSTYVSALRAFKRSFGNLWEENESTH